MKRRTFLINSVLFTGGSLLGKSLPTLAVYHTGEDKETDLYSLFKKPDMRYHPFVRWWWNGNKIEERELSRELRLLEEAGIGGVEINPIDFPSRQEGDDLGIPSLRWLSPEWINMLQHTFDQARRLNMTCDLIVGSGWPFGAETLERDERAGAVLLNAIELRGPADYEISRFTIFKDVDPQVTVPYPGRTFDILSLKLVPDPLGSLKDVIDLQDIIHDEIINIKIPPGKYFLYALVHVKSFASVINGAPGAAGPILNHMDKKAVRKYLVHMSDSIQKHTGPLSAYLRAFFTDSMELEGCNWTDDFAEAFRKKRGYDIMPWLPFILFKVGRLGGVLDFHYGATKSPEFNERVKRVRFDFELTKAELLNERFTQTFLDWCREQGVLSRAQSYGRGFFPLESSLGYDIPEGESWTTNWLKHRVGEEMPDDDYRRGRAYTMINKYVSSAAHLEGNRIVSCEEMTNTYRVFNTSLELLKIGSDQSIMSGITHSVWHGFNYSPPEAPYPGWMQYGSYYSENNNWWPYFKYLNMYKARISSLLQNADMYTDIAIMPANHDLWSKYGVQTEPFPEKLNVEYTSLIWESINKNGGAADYITEIIINNAESTDGKIIYGQKEYRHIILAGIESISPQTLQKLFSFVENGGKVICIGRYPDKAPGLTDYKERDAELMQWLEKLRSSRNNFVLLTKAEKQSYLQWYGEIQSKHSLPHYIEIEKPDPFLMQARYRDDNNAEIIFFSNSNIKKGHETSIRFSEDITAARYGWIWDPESGDRYRIKADANGLYHLSLGPSESKIFVFDRNKTGRKWKDIAFEGKGGISLGGPWELEFIHCRKEKTEPARLDKLKDLKDLSCYSHFSGTVIYRKKVFLSKKPPNFLNLGQVHNISEVYINGKAA
ncbi:MAG: glycoside hydrolase family 2, partial [Bacteroidales bacterium]|nr:glycoside hydrolase family 2 [Bacteroidales bacterium]